MSHVINLHLRNILHRFYLSIRFSLRSRVMLSTFWSALWRSGSNRKRPERPMSVRLSLEPLEERALLSGGLSGGGPGPSPTPNSSSGTQTAVVQTNSGNSGSSGGTGSGSAGISGPGYPLPPTSGPMLPPPSDPSLSTTVTVLVPMSGTPGGSGPSLTVVAVTTGGGPGPSGTTGSSTGL